MFPRSHHSEVAATPLATPLGQPAPAATPAAPAAPTAQPSGVHIVVDLFGALLASLTVGLNGHVTEIVITDVHGTLAIGHNGGIWLAVFYKTTQVATMAFAP